MKSLSTTLGYDVFIAEPIPQNVTELVPNGERRMFSPVSIIDHAHLCAKRLPSGVTAVTGVLGIWAGKSLPQKASSFAHCLIATPTGSIPARCGVEPKPFMPDTCLCLCRSSPPQ